MSSAASGEFLDISGERYYVIRNVEKMAPFFVSVISNTDHWLFVSSTGGLTAGRVSPETALFPYVTVDKIHDSHSHTGSKTLLRVNGSRDMASRNWEPFNREYGARDKISRLLYKNTLGNKLCFEEINHDLELAFRYTWMTSDEFGFVRECELRNLSDNNISIDLVDGLLNILPAGTPRIVQTNTSNLVDAYKWTELDEQTGLALFTLYSGITDKAEPCESLRANTAFCLGLDALATLLSTTQLNDFRVGKTLQRESRKRGIRGAYLVNATLQMSPKTSQRWKIVCDVELSQSEVVNLQRRLSAPREIAEAISSSVNKGSDELARIIASGDGFQLTAEENVSVHHYANVLFNVLRGGIFDDHYNVSSRDFTCTIRQFNRAVAERNNAFFLELPEKLQFAELLTAVEKQNDPQLLRLCREYLPIRFGRRHGDPSRPWNQFSIKLKDDAGNRLLSYEGNWRDIFQNWEALAFSYPEFAENIIAKFVNASTMDGYNPYRITKEGIDWEVEEPDDPWSYIGYWGDHQIIYLLKFLEISKGFHPARLADMLHKPVFSYANVPYRIRPLEALLDNPKATVDYDREAAIRIEHRIANIGADGKLVLDANGDVYLVNLLEKLLVPLLSKLGNLVVDGGIWMNTQRPEWNDANNALVGQGLSMVTLYYLRRYVTFLQQLLASESGETTLSTEVCHWLSDTSAALSRLAPFLTGKPISEKSRYESLLELGRSASHYRETIYRQGAFSGSGTLPLEEIMAMLRFSLAAIDQSIATNQREDGLYHAYNLLDMQDEALAIDTLYPMLEGQVAVLSSGIIAPQKAAIILESLFNSSVYRPDQKSFMLYPDRNLPGFLEKNRIPADRVESIPLLMQMLSDGDDSLIVRDSAGCYRFNSDLTNVGKLNEQLNMQLELHGNAVEDVRDLLQVLYEDVFDHQAFTGRSGGMFGFEGLGCIYWHMVSKLMLAVQENYFAALDQGDDEATCQHLGQLYYRVRAGIGFNKTPAEYGAFPTDPYSHTPRHSGARQPGMTGQVKEEVLSRFGELGLRVSGGAVRFVPKLLRLREFLAERRQFRFLDIDYNWQELTVPAGGLAFTWCQVPIVYELSHEEVPSMIVTLDDGHERTLPQLALPASESAELFERSGCIRRLTLRIPADTLFAE